MNDITLRKIANKKNNDSDFIKLYHLLLANKKDSLTEDDLVFLLRNAVILLNQNNINVKKLGYSIILHYSILYNDYVPLYEIAINFGFIPVSHFIEEHCFSQNNKFLATWMSSYQTNYLKNGIYLTFEQAKLEKFVLTADTNNMLVIAPTSYGKSELMISSISASIPKSCIIVPTKALLSQTKQRVWKQQVDRHQYTKIITHPDMYNNDERFIAILTQERFLTLMQKSATFSVDLLLIDEAHNLLGKETRDILLAQIILIAKKRNPNIKIKYFTPFIENANSLTSYYFNKELDYQRIFEFIKIERFFVYDNKKLIQYDQFTNTFFNETSSQYCNYELIDAKKGKKNIIYANRPLHVEQISQQVIPVSLVNDITISKEYKAIKSFLGEGYNLLDCIKKGIVYHHGCMPDNIKLYVENMYRKYDDLKYIVTTSTLLEGVNIPAEKMFILSCKKGRTNLTKANFINLIGRICRFNDIFNKNSNLRLLEPEIYLINNRQYMPAHFNPQNFLSDRLKCKTNTEDKIENPFLKNDKIQSNNIKHLEFIENIEKNTIPYHKEIKYVTSNIALYCFKNNIQEFDIVANEDILQGNYDAVKNIEKIKTPKDLLEMIYKLFILNIININDQNLQRLANEKARLFYQMLVNWRIQGAIYKVLIGNFIQYWNSLNASEALIYVGSAWGETTLSSNDRFPLYVNIKNKSYKEKLNLAIVRIKEEQDFLDFYIMKYVEVIHELGLIDETFYKQVKYGSSDEKIILMLQNGFSLDLALVFKHSRYNNFIEYNYNTKEVILNKNIIQEMENNEENDILIFEAGYHLHSDIINN